MSKKTYYEQRRPIEDTFQKLNKLPDTKIQELNDFAEFLLNKIEDKIIVDGISEMASKSKVFEFLKDEADLYSVNDVIEKYK
ncbi:MAG: DUF2281 domain-containing protein [Prolixibacteraceae bacterium]|nr:DUF2281 domain-containing protein [Prolixibacteraceae bacterium]